jgi:Domain of unknown function (DUF1707)
MPIEPQDPRTGWTAGEDHMRASDADREQIVDVLKTAFAEGRLSKSELLSRAAQALVSKTYAELRAVTREIPARRVPAPPRPAAGPDGPRWPGGPGRPVSRKAIAWVLSLVIVLPGLGYAFFATEYGSFFIMLLAAFAASVWTGEPGPRDGRRHVY